LARYWLATLMTALTGPDFPWGTLLINVIGSFVIGLFAAALGDRGLFGPALGADGRLDGFVDLRAFVMVGLCGGFTTFSSFSLQTLDLLRAGAWGRGLANVALSVLLCLGAVAAGHALAAQAGGNGRGIAQTAVKEDAS
jgi:CrcB protein